MEIEFFTYGLVFLFLILLSSFFSGSEVAFFSLDPATKEKLRKDKSFLAKRAIYLIANPSLLLITILICNNIVNVSAAVLAALLTYELIGLYHLHQTLLIVFEIIFVTIILLIIGEVTPKIIARKYSMKYVIIATIPISIMVIIFYPLSLFFEKLSNVSKRIIKVDQSKSALRMDEITDLNDIIETQTDIDKTTQKLLSNIGELSKITVRDIQVSRVDLLAINIKMSIDEVVEIVSKSNHTFIPVYNDNIDDIIGVITSSDILKYHYESLKIQNLRSIIHKPLYVPETKDVIELLKEFQSTRIYIAIVVDEHGGTSGMVTLKDILRQMVGLMKAEESKFVKIAENTYVAPGSTPITEIERLFNISIELPELENTTIAGLILHQIEKIPQKGEYSIYKNIIFTVEEVINNRINKVTIKII